VGVTITAKGITTVKATITAKGTTTTKVTTGAIIGPGDY
jgi:hypothetical protein